MPPVRHEDARSGTPSHEFVRTACDPGGDAAACGAGEAWLPGSTGCAPIGHACAADGWPADLPADSGVRDTRSNEGGHYGRGIEVMRGAQVDLSRADISGSKQAALIVVDAGTRLSVTDALIGDPASRVSDGSGGTADVYVPAPVTDLAF